MKREDCYKPPKITAHELWSMDAETFNRWREEHDFPRIIQYFIDKLPSFEKWMTQQNLTTAQLIKHSPARFVRPMKEIYLYELKDDNDDTVELLSYDIFNIGENKSIDARPYKITSKKQKIIPYLKWARGQRKCVDTHVENKFHICSSSLSERKHLFFDNLELLDVGNIKLPKTYMFGDRNLEFINIDDLIIENVYFFGHIRIWYSSARNLTIYGSFPFVDAYKTEFSDIRGQGNSSLNFHNGTFQDWKCTDCDLKIQMTNSTLLLCKIESVWFDITLEHSDIKQCQFSKGNTSDNRLARDFHKKVKKVYSQIGNKLEAGNHFYLEKEFERKFLLQPTRYYNTAWYRGNITPLRKFILYPMAIIKSIYMFFQKVLWGYGEKPIRIFFTSGVIISIATAFYYFIPESQTYKHLFDSLYSSITTFTTIGTGDINPTNNRFLKVCIGLEALSGIALMGLLIAGFASKSKDY